MAVILNRDGHTATYSNEFPRLSININIAFKHECVQEGGLFFWGFSTRNTTMCKIKSGIWINLVHDLSLFRQTGYCFTNTSCAQKWKPR